MRRLNFAQNLKQKRFCWSSANFWKWHKTCNLKNEGFTFVKLQWKHVMTFPFAAKRYTKSQFNEMKRTFDCHFFTFKVKVIFFESRNPIKMKRTFNCNFGFAFTLFSESRNSMKIKRTFNGHFDIVFTVQASLALLLVFLKVAIQWDRKYFQLSFWVVFKAKTRRTLLLIYFESRNSMKMKRTFKCHFDFIFTA